MEHSSVADWIAAIGQAVGAIGTFAAVVVALVIARRDGRRLKREQRQREASQARMITTRTELHWEEIEDGGSSAIIVRNNSNQAISSLTVRKAKVDGPNIQWFPDDEAGGGLAMLGPGDSAHFNGSWRTVDDAGDEPPTANTLIRFVDASGIWWDRVNNSEPRRSYPEPVAD